MQGLIANETFNRANHQQMANNELSKQLNKYVPYLVTFLVLLLVIAVASCCFCKCCRDACFQCICCCCCPCCARMLSDDGSNTDPAFEESFEEAAHAQPAPLPPPVPQRQPGPMRTPRFPGNAFNDINRRPPPPMAQNYSGPQVAPPAARQVARTAKIIGNILAIERGRRKR